MKKIRFILLTILCCLPTIIFAAGKDTDSYIECWYNRAAENEIYYYYNVTTDEFKYSGSITSYHSYTSSVLKSDFMDKTTNTLRCPTLYTKTGANSGRSAVTNISTTKKDNAYQEIKLNKTNSKNAELTTTKTCIYSKGEHKIEYILDTAKKTIVSAKINTLDASTNAFTYDEIFKDSKCVDIKDMYGYCAGRGDVLICHIVKEKDYPGVDYFDPSLEQDEPVEEEKKEETPSNNGNHATEKDFTGNLSCGGTSFKFPKSLPNFTNVIFDLLKIATPVIIIITGMMDMFKAVAAQKEDEIKKGQQKLLRRLLAGAVVFLVFVIVETAIHAFADSNDAQNAMDCVDCFLVDSDSCTTN